jgi:hypothetical protein
MCIIQIRKASGVLGRWTLFAFLYSERSHKFIMRRELDVIEYGVRLVRVVDDWREKKPAFCRRFRERKVDLEILSC